MQGWGALVAGHVQQRALPEATAVLARFCELGGCPDARMVDGIVGLCMLQRDRRHAAKVRAAGAVAAGMGKLLVHGRGALSCLWSSFSEPWVWRVCSIIQLAHGTGRQHAHGGQDTCAWHAEDIKG